MQYEDLEAFVRLAQLGGLEEDCQKLQAKIFEGAVLAKRNAYQQLGGTPEERVAKDTHRKLFQALSFEECRLSGHMETCINQYGEEFNFMNPVEIADARATLESARKALIVDADEQLAKIGQTLIVSCHLRNDLNRDWGYEPKDLTELNAEIARTVASQPETTNLKKNIDLGEQAPTYINNIN